MYTHTHTHTLVFVSIHAAFFKQRNKKTSLFARSLHWHHLHHWLHSHVVMGSRVVIHNNRVTIGYTHRGITVVNDSTAIVWKAWTLGFRLTQPALIQNFVGTVPLLFVVVSRHLMHKLGIVVKVFRFNCVRGCNKQLFEEAFFAHHIF